MRTSGVAGLLTKFRRRIRLQFCRDDLDIAVGGWIKLRVKLPDLHCGVTDADYYIGLLPAAGSEEGWKMGVGHATA